MASSVGDERRSFGEAGENRAVANRRIDHEGRPLRHLQGVKFRRALRERGLRSQAIWRARAVALSRGRSRPRAICAAISQSPIFFPSRSSARLRAIQARSSSTPRSRAASAMQFGSGYSARPSSTQLVLQHARASASACRCAGSTIRCARELAGSPVLSMRAIFQWKSTRSRVARLHFLPGRDRPKAPGGNDIEVVGDGKSHGTI